MNIFIYAYVCKVEYKWATLKLNSMTADPPLSETTNGQENLFSTHKHTHMHFENEHCRKFNLPRNLNFFLTNNAQFAASSSSQRDILLSCLMLCWTRFSDILFLYASINCFVPLCVCMLFFVSFDNLTTIKEIPYTRWNTERVVCFTVLFTQLNFFDLFRRQFTIHCLNLLSWWFVIFLSLPSFVVQWSVLYVLCLSVYVFILVIFRSPSLYFFLCFFLYIELCILDARQVVSVSHFELRIFNELTTATTSNPTQLLCWKSAVRCDLCVVFPYVGVVSCFFPRFFVDHTKQQTAELSSKSNDIERLNKQRSTVYTCIAQRML